VKEAFVSSLRALTTVILTLAFGGGKSPPSMLLDHEVVLDAQGRLMPWASYDNILGWSMNFIKGCPRKRTRLGEDPWYLVTSVFRADGSYKAKQNNQGSNTYWAVETLRRYYAYSGDAEAIQSVRLLVDRVLQFHTPPDWAWPDVPRTQDDTPDGEYTDERGEPDKICMVGVAYINFHKLTGEKKYLEAALRIARTISQHVRGGESDRSPLPFRVNLRTGKVLADYTANMVYAVMLFDELITLGYTDGGGYQRKRDVIWEWILRCSLVSNNWAGYFEDVPTFLGYLGNLNQQSPMETARYILEHSELDPAYREHVPALISWVASRFGRTKRYGATSIREQDFCFLEMGSHTARYASIVAKWFGVTLDPKDREEALSSFALATYSAYNKYSKSQVGINYTGLGYRNPWFSDSYFDYLPHILSGMAELPEMAPEASDHVIGSDSTITRITYLPKRIEYQTFELRGSELLRITFKPHHVLAEGRPLDESRRHYGTFRGVTGVLRIQREGERSVSILGE
jgi:hypothetical protein